MNKFLRYSFLMLLALICGNMNAETIVFGDLKLENGVQYTDPFDGGSFTVTFGGGGNNGKYYTTGSGVRVYADGTMTVAAKTGVLTRIVVTYDGSNKPTSDNIINDGSYDVESGTWTGASASVVFTRPTGSGHWRIKSVEATVNNSGQIKTGTTIELSGDYLTRFTPGKDGDETDLPTATVKANGANVEGATTKWSLTMGTNWIMGEEEPSLGNGKVYIPNHSCGDLTLTAKYEGNDQYEASSKSYTLKVYKGYLNIQSILEEFPVVGGDSWATKETEWNKGYLASFWQADMPEGQAPKSKEALVTFVSGSYTYIKDDFGSILLYGGGLGFKQGDKISGDFGQDKGFGAIYGTLKSYNGLLEMVVNKNDVEFTVKSNGNEVTPKTISLKELNQTNMHEFLKIENAEFVSADSKNLTFKVGGETLAVYNQFGVKLTDDKENSLLVAGTKYDLEGMGCIYWKNGTLTNQLYLTSFEEKASGQDIKSFKLTINHDGEVFTESFPASDWENINIEGKTSSLKILKAVVETNKPMNYVGFIGTMYNAEDGWQHDENAWRTVDFKKQDDGTWVIDMGEGLELIESEWLDKNKTKTFEFFVYAEDEANNKIHYNNGGQNYKVTFSTDDPTAINGVNSKPSTLNSQLYNMSGQSATRTYRGVVIQNARKVLRK